jgi:hypothetical protein
MMAVLEGWFVSYQVKSVAPAMIQLPFLSLSYSWDMMLVMHNIQDISCAPEEPNVAMADDFC